MASKPDGHPERRRPRLWLKVLTASAVFLLLLAAGGLAVVRYVLAPAVVREKVREGLAESWDGEVRLGDMELSLFGPVSFSEIEFLDRHGRSHLALSRVALDLSNYPSRSPVLTGLDLHGVTVNLYKVDGELVMPVRKSQRESDFLDKYVRLDDVVLRDVNISLHEDGDLVSQYGWDHIRLARRQEWSLEIDGEPLLEGISLTGPGENAAAETYELHAVALGGTLDARVVLAEGPHGRSVTDGTASVQNLDMRRMSDLAGRDLGKGVLNGSLGFTADELSVGAIRGSGNLDVSEVDAGAAPVTAQLLDFLNGSANSEPALSKVAATFDVSGPVLTVREAELTDALRAMSVEEGGTVNLQTGQLDFYLVTLQLRGLGGVASSLPMLNVATILTNKLTRFHATGTWDKQTITKEPVKDLSAASIEIFEEAMTGTAGMPSGVVDGIMKLLGGI
jgi:hypothetical protein